MRHFVAFFLFFFVGLREIRVTISAIWKRMNMTLIVSLC